MATSTDKPHIYRLRGIMNLQFWVCRMQGKVDGFGRDPQSAYRHWVLANSGTWRDRKVVTSDAAAHAVWWVSAWEACKRFIVGGLVAAAVLWLFWR